MLNLRPLDAACPIEQQLQNSATPVVLVNLFTVDEADTPAPVSYTHLTLPTSDLV